MQRVKTKPDKSTPAPASTPAPGSTAGRLDVAGGMDAELASLPLRIAPAAHPHWITPAGSADWPEPAALAAERARAVERLSAFYARISAGRTTPVADLHPIVDALLDRLSAFPSRFTQLALLVRGDEEYLPDHGYTVSVLATAIAGHLKWAREDARLAGLAGLLFDVGMYRVPERVRRSPEPLSEQDRAGVREHPLQSAAMLTRVKGLPPIVRLAALQHHERENGSGYPNGLRQERICDLARVLAVADAFAATMSERAHRPRKLPYLAMEETRQLAASMVLWKPACHALLQAAGLFPVGSFVKLSTGQRAHVIGSHAEMPERPVVRLLDAAGRPVGKPVDLAQAGKEAPAIVRPIHVDALAA